MTGNVEKCTICGEAWNASPEGRRPYVCPDCSWKYKSRKGEAQRFGRCFTRGTVGRSVRTWEV